MAQRLAARVPLDRERGPHRPRAGRTPHGVSADGSIIVGCCDELFPGERLNNAWRWTPSGGLEHLTVPGYDAQAYGLSPEGDAIVGGQFQWTGFPSPLRWIEGVGWEELGHPDPLATEALAGFGASSQGAVVVGADRWGSHGAFVWDAAHGSRWLDEVLEGEHGVDLGGVRLTDARGISSDGTRIAASALTSFVDGQAYLVSLAPACSDGLDNDGNGRRS